ncbi:RNA ligase [Salinirubrum litoreum]|uniref:RNA ligase n=1 Tax=Salinirubrum litoreum TaxID=1126234 RepID=A0ABD5RAS5_9EURY|nr:RNA ligase [Salinirubrum litoreum]
MDERAYYDRIDSTAADPPDLFEHFERRSVDGRVYHVLPSPSHGVEGGTVIDPTADAVVRGYPSVPRVLVLDPGLTTVFDADESVVIEEKLNGANVRVVDLRAVAERDVTDHGERSATGTDAGGLAAEGPVALTRSGHVCPYTTERVRDALDLDPFFADHPEAMLCAELIGPETPYTTHDYADVGGDAIRVFGVRDRETGRPLPVSERRERCVSYDLPQVASFGRVEAERAAATVREVIETLDDERREGVVVKSVDGSEMVKYTTEAQHHADLAHAFGLPFDYGQDFLFSRVIREVFQTVEFDEDAERRRARAHALGESILLPAADAVETVAGGGAVGTDHTVRGTPATVTALLDHLREQSITVEVRADDREDGERVVRFRKRSAASTDRIAHYLDGGIVDE